MQPTNQSADRQTWESIKLLPAVATLLRTDPEFARLVRSMVETFGALEAVEATETAPVVLEVTMPGKRRPR